MQFPGVRAVVFDAVGTLILPCPSAADVYAEVGRRFGSRLTSTEIAPLFGAAFAEQERVDLQAGLRTSEKREWRRWRRIVAQVLYDASDSEACFRELFDHFGRPDAWCCCPGATKLLPALSERGYALGVDSNYDGRLRKVIGGFPQLSVIPHMVISSEAGWRKPAAGFYHVLCSTLELRPGEILHVGDDAANDYEGALAAGLQAVLLDPSGPSARATACITRLDDLLTELT